MNAEWDLIECGFLFHGGTKEYDKIFQQTHNSHKNIAVVF